ncbi:IS3 family transposase [Acetobacter senegalensis]|uniref:IS3 family transposase n=1 Tax=Acetobacter senegalensis TaxID=446692 RepID=UPI00264B6071|nr:IS3 family transposase [Acetobacter senegalensis]MDN7351020.1 IS3 family transposase [Acetobacter senegalensis]MDN7351040.1 IS3 family transposase [Acetobacter senegalensis]
MSNKSKRFPPEFRERAARMVLEEEKNPPSRWSAVMMIAPKLDIHPDTLSKWTRLHERANVPAVSDLPDREKIRQLERENRELRQANEILRKASAYFCPGGTRPHLQAMTRFIEEHRQTYGVGSICRVLSIAPSAYYASRARQENPCVRSQKDKELCHEICWVWNNNFCVYGARKVWHQLKREGLDVARCTVERLMRRMGLKGVMHGKGVRTIRPDPARPCPQDLVRRQFHAPAPNRLWVSDFTYVSTWQGFVYVAFIIDVFARVIVGWRVSSTAHTDFVLDALEQALCQRRPEGKVTHHSDRGCQYVSIRYTQRLAEAGLVASVGSVGDSYDNALAETINGLYKTELIYRQGPWKNREAVELATLKWVDWFNNRRLLSSIGNIPPAEAEARFYAQQKSHALAA